MLYGSRMYPLLMSHSLTIVRIASAREGFSSRPATNASNGASKSSCRRTWIWVPLPVGAGPRFFFGTTV